MENKILALELNKTWELVPLSSGKIWVYKIKIKTDESIYKYKAYLVAKGNTQ